MVWTWLDTSIVLVGALSAMACALLGNYLVLRKMSMMGDAVSHAVLPGLAVAFLITGSRDSLPMFVGACLVGVLTALLVHTVQRFGELEEGASMGVVFTSLFALGLVLIRRAADHVDLDPGCVLYGAIELAPLDTVQAAGFEVPRAAVTVGAVLLLNVLFVALFYKELKVSSFDPGLATSLGINADLMHYALMTLVAVTTVAVFESVGSILVIAMLIVPPAAAYLLTERLSVMIPLSLVLAAASAVLGHLGAITVPAWFGFVDTGTAGMMAVAAGCLFALALVLSPTQGLAGKALRGALVAFHIVRQDVIGMLYRHEELAAAGAPDVPQAKIREMLGHGPSVSVALWDLTRRGRLARTPAGYRLTDRGRDEARQLVRSHRLWETYLVTVLGSDPERVHDRAERVEHVIDPVLQERLDEASGYPQRDPHEDEIPAGPEHDPSG